MECSVSPLPRGILGAASALGILLCPGAAHASGVNAGTLIQNTATATFTAGTQSGTVQSNTVTIKVDELLNVAVAGLTSSLVASGPSNYVLAYSVTNSGNGQEAFAITVTPAVAGNDFDTVVQSVAIDSNGNGTYDPGVDQVLATGASTPAIAPDSSLRLFAIVNLPPGTTDAQTSQVTLKAEATTGTGAPGTAFAGAGEGGGDAVVGASGASSSAQDSLVTSLATVSLTKSASISDQFGGARPVPGAAITYTLLATVSGSGSVAGLHVTDAIPSGSTYRAGSLTLDGTALSDAADSDGGTASAAGIDVSLGTVTGGTSRTIKFAVTIN